MRPATIGLGLAVLMVALAFAVPARPAQAADMTGMYGGNLRMAVLATPSWNPLSTSFADASVHNLVWDTLARPDPATGEPKPWAALGWTVDTSAKTITVTPRPGLMWSTGAAITLADLRTTFTQFGFTVSVSGTDLVFSFPSGGAGRFYSEALYDGIAWNSAQVKMYSGLFAPSPANTSLLLANTRYWAGRPYLDSVSLVVAGVDDAACKLLKSHGPGFALGVDMIGYPLLPNELTDERTCTRYGGFTDDEGNPLNKSLVNPNATKSEPYISAVHHPGPRFMYYWMNVAGGGVMTDVNFRNAIYLFVNKQLAASIEPSSAVTMSLINRAESFWYMPEWEVVRDAGFTAIRDSGGTPRQDTNPYPGVQAMDKALYLDRNGDGWRETPAGAPFTVRIGSLAFLNSPDPRKATITGAYVDVLRRQGVNAVHVEFTSWAELRNAESAGTVDMALDVADYATANPRFIETFQPLIAAADPDIDLHLTLGKNAMTLAERALHYNHVTYYNSLCACVLPVLHFETLEVYDRDVFSGWVDAYGGINNVWSFANLKLPPLGALKLSLSTFSNSVPSGQSTTVQVVVVDQGDAPVEDVNVELVATIGTLTTATGTTDVNGRFSTPWAAPMATENVDATVSVTVSKPQYQGAVASTSITVHPPYHPLGVAVTLANTELDAGQSTDVQVLVTSSGVAVQGADVTLTVSLPGGTLAAYSGTTDGSGAFHTTFSATPSVRSIYRIDVDATMAGYAPGARSGSVIVSPRPIQASDYQTINVIQNVPGFETLAVIAAIGAAVALLRWRRRREG